MAEEQNYATVGGTKVYRSDFAYAPEGSKPSEWKLPIHDENHVRNALSRFNQTELPAAAKAAAKAKILARAKKYKIDTSGFEEKNLGDLSFERLRSLVDAELSKHFPKDKSGYVKAYIKEMYPDYAIVESEGKLYRVNYTISDEEVKTEKPVEVEVEYAILSEVRDGLVRIPLAYSNAPGTVFEQAGIKFKITEQDLEDIRKNLAEHEVVIDYDHLSASAHAQPPGWAKAAGWLAKPETIEPFTDGRKLLWGWARFTPAMLAMLKDQEYRYCSIDFRWKDKNELGESVGTYLHALAMTNRPFLKDLPPIEISNEDYQQLMGMAVREDGKLAALTLSESGARLISPEAVHVPGNVKTVSVGYGQAAPGGAKGGKTMARKAKLAKGASKGKFAVRTDDGLLDDLDDISFDELFDVFGAGSLDDLEEALAKQGFSRTKKASEIFFAETGTAEILRSAQDDKAARAEVKTLVEKGRAAADAKPAPKSDAVLFSEVADATGKLDRIKAAKLTDDGTMKHETFVRLDETAQKVDAQIRAGKILPKRRKEAMTLALSDAKAFDALLEDSKPIVDTSVHGVGLPADGGTPASMQLSTLIHEHMEKNKTLSYEQAELAVVSTKEGMALWEQKRLEELEAPNKLAARA